ncbi:MAG: ACT domain-containing protein [Chloroflexi bacterium]|nr:ACT domain-containing protein [Chloroflexota bacterium]
MLTLSVLPESLMICRLDQAAAIPAWATGDFISITRTSDELSIVCNERDVPPGVKTDRNWRALKIEGPLDLSLTGVLASIAVPLAEAKINLFAISTFDTDYVLVKAHRVAEAIGVLRSAGHRVE